MNMYLKTKWNQIYILYYKILCKVENFKTRLRPKGNIVNQRN